MGHPGSKPALNAKALLFAVKVALALGCRVNNEFFFSRKTYFYPDMAKNFQISQFEIPIGTGGAVNLPSGKKVRIRRVHLEEDPAALVHTSGVGESNYCLVDYNRSGVPLVEIVTDPDMDSPDDARQFLDQLTTILAYLKVYSAATGTLKADTNVSVYGHSRVEVKNVNGKKAVEKALVYEIARQKNLLLHEREIVRETRAFDEKTQSTKSLRTKETEEDYGFIFEPDLTAIVLSDAEIEKMKRELPELHESKAKRFVGEFGLDEYTANVIARNYSLSRVFAEVVEKGRVDPKVAAKFLSRELMAVVNRSGLELDAIELDPGEVASLLNLFVGGKITEKVAKEAIIAYLTKGTKPTVFIEKHGLAKDMGGAEIEKAVESVLGAHPGAVADIKAGKAKTMNFLVGQVMRLTKAKADARAVQSLIEKKVKGAKK
ncbi:MAG: Asp-tRNA(Asn)/Glu-tRNA(Gln) amidotransferase subunit GatB [Candidatus Diapherotrites archaeon]|nr:Asp-tRNA(Asn)/Glu-tRNA(Gln) amidotransferase subunit GatB [Candidatus Diapherotrites archaeon]